MCLTAHRQAVPGPMLHLNLFIPCPADKQQVKPLWQLSRACVVLDDYAKIPTISSAHLTYQRSANAGHAAGSEREPLEN